jgi:signal transduction histidine kinase
MSFTEGISVTLRLELTFTVITTLLAWHLWRVYPGRALQHLAIGWAFWSVRFVLAVWGASLLAAAVPAHTPVRRFITAASMLVAVGSVVFLRHGTLAVAGVRERDDQPWRCTLLFGVPPMVLALLTTGESAPMWWRMTLLLTSSTVLYFGVFVYISWRLLKHERDDLTTGRQIAAVAYTLFSAKQLYNVVAYVQAGAPTTSPPVYSEAVVFALVGIGTIALLLERERQRGVQAVNEQRRLEAELAARDRLDSLGRLAGGVAHDFNNMLTTILGNVQLARVQLAGGQPAHEELSEIETTATRASALSRHLLAFARRERVQPMVFDLTERLLSLRPYLHRQLAAGVQFHVAVPGVPVWVKADPERIDQALINLVRNAGDAMPPGGGSISVRLASRADTTAGQAVLQVEDTGSGMRDEVRVRIFEPFFTTKGLDRGTGLGLSIVHGAVMQAGGSITVSSRLGQGTIFEIVLPLTTAPVSSPPVTEPRLVAESYGNTRVLVVDDDPLVRRVAVRLLTKRGFIVLDAADGDEALAVHAATTDPIHLVLSDVVMPGMNGRTLARRLRERDASLAVVYMSGYEADAFVDEPDAPDGPFIAKPFSEANLLAGMENALTERASA